MELITFNLDIDADYRVAYIHVPGMLNPGGGIPVLVDNDLNQYPLLEGYALHRVPVPMSDRYETFSDHGHFVGNEKPVDHSYIKERLLLDVRDSDNVFYTDEFEQAGVLWRQIATLPFSTNPVRAIMPVKSLDGNTHFQLGETSIYHFHEDRGWYYYEVHNVVELQHIDNTHYIGVGSYREGAYYPNGTPLWESKSSGTSPVQYTGSNYGFSKLGSTGWNIPVMKRLVSDMLVDLFHKGKRLLDTHPERYWQASLSAADAVQAYDLNMVEAAFGFSMEDLFPKNLAENSLKAIREVVDNGNFATALLRATQISGSMYLYNKYVIGNNIADICQITGVSPDIAQNISIVLSDPACNESAAAEYNWQLAQVARRIVYGEAYKVSTYGGKSYQPVYGPGRAVLETHAKLIAIPGPWYDATVAGILVDEFGLKLTAERYIQTVRFEFIANWFFPIEETIHSLENNSSVLNVRFNVSSLTLSDRLSISYDIDMLKILYGLSEVSGSVYSEYYTRFVLEEFPRTVLAPSPDSGGISMSRILQGGSLLINA